jgi:hypothetical protein
MVSEADARNILDKLMTNIAGFKQSNLDDFLLSDTDEIISNLRETAYAEIQLNDDIDDGQRSFSNVRSGGKLPDPKKAHARDSSKEAWPKKHEAAFEALGEARANFRMPAVEVLLQFPFLAKMTLRQHEMLHLKGIRDFPEAAPRVVDISQTDAFSKVTDNLMQCLTPSGCKYLSHKCRPVVGVEALRLQGLWYDRGVTSQFKDELLRSLAGNAFEASCCAAMFWTAFQFKALMHIMKQQQPSPSLEIGAKRKYHGAAQDDEVECIWGRQAHKKRLRITVKTTFPDECYWP